MNFQSISIENEIKVTEWFSNYHITMDKNYHFAGERHNFWELVFVKKGTIGITADNNCYELSENNVVFHQPGQFHSVWSSGGTTPEVYIMSFAAEGKLMKKYENCILKLKPENAVFLMEIFNCLNNCMVTETDGKQVHKAVYIKNADVSLTEAAEHLLEYLLVILKNTTDEKDELLKSSAIITHSEIYSGAVDFMKANLYNKISIDDICKTLGVGKTTLKEVFAKYSGWSIMKWFLNLKIDTAKQMLKNGDNVNEVSERLAFSSQNYFWYAFKRETGLTPLEYKKTVKNETKK